MNALSHLGLAGSFQASRCSVLIEGFVISWYETEAPSSEREATQKVAEMKTSTAPLAPKIQKGQQQSPTNSEIKALSEIDPWKPLVSLGRMLSRKVCGTAM